MTQQIPSEQEVKDILISKLNAGEITREEAAAKMSAYRKLQSGQSAPKQAIDQPQTLSQPDPSIGDRVVGDVQALGQVAAGAIAEPVAGIAGIVAGGLGGADQAAGAVEAVRRFPENLPLNQSGADRLKQLGAGFQAVTDKANQGLGVMGGISKAVSTGSVQEGLEAGQKIASEGISNFLGDEVIKAGGSPEVAALAFTLPSAGLEAMGVKGARNLKGQTILGNELKVLSSNPNQALLQAAPSIDRLKKRAGELYSQIDDAKAVVDDTDYLNLAIEVKDLATRQGFDPRTSQQLAPNTQALLQLIEDDVGNPLTFSQIDQTRRMANVAAQSLVSPIDKAIGSIVKDKLDFFLDGQADKLAKSGDAELSGKFKQARQLWSKAKKAETLDELVANADLQASGFENGLRIGFRSLLKDKRKSAGFTTDERALMTEIVEGTTLANTFKKLGKLGFGDAQQSNMLMASLGGAAGFGAAGPLGAVTVPAVGTISSKLATRLTANKSKMLQEITKAGPDSQQIVSAYLRNTPKAGRDISDLTELLMRPEVDLSSLKKGPVNQIVADAAFAAEYLRDIGAANLIEVPAIIEGIKQEDDK